MPNTTKTDRKFSKNKIKKLGHRWQADNRRRVNSLQADFNSWFRSLIQYNPESLHTEQHATTATIGKSRAAVRRRKPKLITSWQWDANMWNVEKVTACLRIGPKTDRARGIQSPWFKLFRLQAGHCGAFCKNNYCLIALTVQYDSSDKLHASNALDRAGGASPKKPKSRKLWTTKNFLLGSGLLPYFVRILHDKSEDMPNSLWGTSPAIWAIICEILPDLRDSNRTGILVRRPATTYDLLLAESRKSTFKEKHNEAIGKLYQELEQIGGNS